MNAIVTSTNRCVDALCLLGSGSGCLDSMIRGANSKGNPIDLDTLQLALEFEKSSPWSRPSIVNMLAREIRRQDAR